MLTAFPQYNFVQEFPVTLSKILTIDPLELGFPEMVHHGINFNIAYSKVRQLKHLICKIYLQVHQI